MTLDPIREVVAGSSSSIVQGSILDYASSIDLASIDLVYADLPYCTGHDFYMDGEDGKVLAYSDRYPSPEKWAAAMGDLYRVLRERVKLGGNVLAHVDWRYSHLLRAEIAKHLESTWFRHPYDLTNEIIWRYRRMPAKTNRAFQSVHDSIYRWTQQAVMVDGKRVKSSSTAEESPGVRMGDVWELPIVAPSANERNGYPTQKSEALLSRVVLSMSNPGGLVVDLTCGSGTTGAVALKHGRRFLGFDTSPVAVRVSRARLTEVAASLTPAVHEECIAEPSA